jgi:hypothetical protein
MAVLPGSQVQYQAPIHVDYFWVWKFPLSPEDSQLMHQHLLFAVKHNQII